MKNTNLAAQKLREAAKLILGGHWTRHELSVGTGDNVKYCAIGAIEAVTPYPSGLFDNEIWDLQMDCKSALRNIVGYCIDDWNDNKVRDAREVSRTMIKAARSWNLRYTQEKQFKPKEKTKHE